MVVQYWGTSNHGGSFATVPMLPLEMGPQAETKLVTEVHINPCMHRTNAQLHQTHGYT